MTEDEPSDVCIPSVVLLGQACDYALQVTFTVNLIILSHFLQPFVKPYKAVWPRQNENTLCSL